MVDVVNVRLPGCIFSSQESIMKAHRSHSSTSSFTQDGQKRGKESQPEDETGGDHSRSDFDWSLYENMQLVVSPGERVLDFTGSPVIDTKLGHKIMHKKYPFLFVVLLALSGYVLLFVAKVDVRENKGWKEGDSPMCDHFPSPHVQFIADMNAEKVRLVKVSE